MKWQDSTTVYGRNPAAPGCIKPCKLPITQNSGWYVWQESSDKIVHAIQMMPWQSYNNKYNLLWDLSMSYIHIHTTHGCWAKIGQSYPFKSFCLPSIKVSCISHHDKHFPLTRPPSKQLRHLATKAKRKIDRCCSTRTWQGETSVE